MRPAIARLLGGGGHPQAASAISKASLDEARARLADGLPGTVREPLLAGRLMSSPARTVGPDETVARALVACQRHGQSGILVVEDERLVGVVGREDLDRAVAHGLSHAPVKGIMSTRVATCSEDTPLAELQRLLSGGDDRVAVMDGERIAGVVTRTDLLRALGAQVAQSERAGPMLADELTRLDRLQPVFEAVAAVSEPFEGVYLVGGTVRDILLGERGFDVDVAVEGDAIALAQALADALGGRVRAHRKFGTAVVIYGEGERVDVVTARTEFYDAPAALPTVEHASIREDLFRRDFTINAMAVSLRGADLGRLVDPFRGRRDLDAKTIRVLHNLSFIDDPTRIFRAIRYENRYGFRMDEHTLRLARGTHRDGARRRSLLCAPARRARGATGGGRDRALDPAPGGARGRPRDSSTSRRGRGGGGARAAPGRAAERATGSRSPPGGSGWQPWRGGSRRTRCTTGSSG